MTTTSNKPKTWFWIVSALALVWNLMGVMAFITDVTRSAEALQALPDDQRSFYSSVPSWANGAFAIAVFGGALGCLLLLLQKKLATPVLIVSFVGILVQLFHAFFIGNSFQVFGPGGTIMPVMVLGIAVALIWFSRKATANGWLK